MICLACIVFRRHQVWCDNVMQRWKFTREFKPEAVRLIRDREGSYAQVSEDWACINLNCATGSSPKTQGHAFAGNGQMKPEQLEIARPSV